MRLHVYTIQFQDSFRYFTSIQAGPWNPNITFLWQRNISAQGKVYVFLQLHFNFTGSTKQGFQRKHHLWLWTPSVTSSKSWWQISEHIYRGWWIFSLQMACHNELIPLHVTGNWIFPWEGNCMRSMNIWCMDISKQPDLEKIKTALYSQSLRPPHRQDPDFNLLQVAELRKAYSSQHLQLMPSVIIVGRMQGVLAHWRDGHGTSLPSLQSTVFWTALFIIKSYHD